MKKYIYTIITSTIVLLIGFSLIMFYHQKNISSLIDRKIDDTIVRLNNKNTDTELVVKAQECVVDNTRGIKNIGLIKKVVFEIDNIFMFRKASLNDNGKLLLDDVMNEIRPGTIVTVVGHSDRIGGKAFNKKLSQKRANVVVAYMENKVDATFKSYGVGSMIPSGKTDECKGRNSNPELIKCLAPDRRVEIEFVQK